MFHTVSPHTFRSIADEWVNHKTSLAAAGLLALGTAKTYRSTVKSLCAYAGLADRPVNQITRRVVDDYVMWRMNKSLVQPATLNLELVTLRAVLSYAEEEGHITERDIPRSRRVPMPLTEKEIPEPEKIWEVMREMPARRAMPLKFAMLTGMSWYEIEQLQWRDIVERKRKLPPFDGDHFIKIGERPDFRVKTEARRRRVPVAEEVRRVLKDAKLHARADRGGKMPEDTDPVFPGAHGMRQFLSRFRSRKHPAIFSPRTMRTLFATAAAGIGMPENQLQRLMGHSPGSKITRQHYIRANRDQLTRAASDVASVLAS